MDLKLFFNAIIKFLFGIILVGALLFIPAGSFNYYNGHLFMVLLFVPMFIAGVIMMIYNPELLRSRLSAREKINTQNMVVLLSGFMFIFGFILAGLNYRYNWIHLPRCIIIISSIVFILSYILYGEVLRENTFLSRTIEVKKDQKVIDKGLYKIVRHPMYLTTIFLFLSIPLILDSLISFFIFLVYPFIICKRINSEEQVLNKELKGYKKYKEKVKYKLIPYVW